MTPTTTLLDRRGRAALLSVVVSVVLLAGCSDGPAGRAGTPSPTGSASESPAGTATGTGRDDQSAPTTSAPGPAASSDPVPAAFPRRPNLLVIEADDMRSDELRWMPRTRRLIGSAGLAFHNSFAPNPLCCPSRASFLTGQYSHNHRVLSHESPYGFGSFDDTSTLATALQARGYRTALVGKYLNGYGVQGVHATGAASETYVPPGWDQWYGGLDNGPGREGGTYSYFDLTSNVNGRPTRWPGQYSTDVTAAQTVQLLDEFSRPATAGTGRRPWFLWWTPIAPHHGGPVEADDPGWVTRSDGFRQQFVTPARPRSVWGSFDDRIPRGLGVPRSGEPEADTSDKPAYLRAYPRLTGAELDALRTVSRQRAEALSVLDARVADVLGHLKSLGEVDSTVVVFTSDNGYYLGEHRKRQGKINLHEPSIRVPLLVAGPEIPAGDRYDPATTVDLSATLVELAGVAPPHPPDGVSLASTIFAGDQGWTRPVVLEGRMPEPAYARAGDRRAFWDGLDTAGLRLGRWKYVAYATGEKELYDLRRDPLELRSISAAAQPALHAEMAALFRRYFSCAGPTCRAPAPEALQVPAAENRVTTRRQDARRAAYVGTEQSP